jgi:hypothetical protein
MRIIHMSELQVKSKELTTLILKQCKILYGANYQCYEIFEAKKMVCELDLAKHFKNNYARYQHKFHPSLRENLVVLAVIAAAAAIIISR